MPDGFTRDLWAWLRQVRADSDLPPAAFKLAFVIAEHVNRKSRTAWPTQQTLAAAARSTDRTVRSLIAKLIDRGHLAVEAGGGWRRPNVYRLVGDRKPASAHGLSSRKPASAEGRKFGVDMGGSHRPTEQYEGTVSKKHAAPDSLFSQFWSEYPKRKGDNPKKPAQDIFARAVKSGADPGDLVAAAKRYRLECERDGKLGTPYIAQALTWLRQHRWEDYAEGGVAEPDPAAMERVWSLKCERYQRDGLPAAAWRGVPAEFIARWKAKRGANGAHAPDESENPAPP